MLIPNPRNKKLKVFNEVLCELFNSVNDFLPPFQFKNYVISQCQMRWKVCQDVRAVVKLCNELIEDSNGKSGYAISIRKLQEYPSKPCVSDVKCAENTKAYLWKFVEDIKEKMWQLRERSSKLYHTNHQIPAHKSNELSFYEKQLEILRILRKQRSH